MLEAAGQQPLTDQNYYDPQVCCHLSVYSWDMSIFGGHTVLAPVFVSLGTQGNVQEIVVWCVGLLKSVWYSPTRGKEPATDICLSVCLFDTGKLFDFDIKAKSTSFCSNIAEKGWFIF